ncbi:uncharacterized protein DS421_5g136180 [Arachis hypogaea]|nr:uncharacterized protein DS421_5g136180 [Arachis hypogaea]
MECGTRWLTPRLVARKPRTPCHGGSGMAVLPPTSTAAFVVRVVKGGTTCSQQSPRYLLGEWSCSE